jgi:hypothetical protein
MVHTPPPARERCVRLTRHGRRCALPRAREKGDGTLCNVHYHVDKRRRQVDRA